MNNKNKISTTISLAVLVVIMASFFLDLPILASKRVPTSVVAHLDSGAENGQLIINMIPIRARIVTAKKVLAYGKEIPMWAQLTYLVCILLGAFSKVALKQNSGLPRLRLWVVPGLLVYVVVYPILIILAKEDISAYSFAMAFSFGFFWQGFVQVR